MRDVTVDGVADREGLSDRIVYRGATYAEVPGFRHLLLDLVVPIRPDPVPVVMYIHGGGFAGGTHQLAKYPPARRPTEMLTARGIAVAGVGYRLSAEARFPAPVHDVKAAARWLKHHGPALGIDPTRLGAWGNSAGGYLTAMLAVTAGHPELDGTVGVTGPDARIRAGVSWYGPANLSTQPRLGPPVLGLTDPARSPESTLLGAAVASVPELAATASPITHASARSAPLLLVHGTADDGVPFSQSEELVAAYRRAGARIDLVPVPGAGHGVPGVDLAPLLRRSVDFLVEHLTAG